MAPPRASLLLAAAAALLLLASPASAQLAPASYEYVGPFPMGRTELDGDPLVARGGADALFERHERGEKQRFLSELATGGYVGWQTLRAARGSGAARIEPKVNWNQLVSGLSGRGVLEFQGWAFGRVQVPSAGRYLASCAGVTSFWLDGALLTGDVYQTGRAQWPVQLEQGSHLFRLRPRGTPPISIACRLTPAPAPAAALQLQQPPFLPDVLERGFLGGSAALSLPVLNTSPDWMRLDRVELGDGASSDLLAVSLLATAGVLIAPGQLVLVPAVLTQREPQTPLKCALRISLRLRGVPRGGGAVWTNSEPLEMECRKRADSFRYTFIDHDGSVGESGAVAPWGIDLPAIVPIVLSLHGTGVSARSQADSYKFMPPKGSVGYTKKGKYRFGVEGAWLCTPDRHGAHNWDSATGQRTAIAAAEALSTLSRHHTWSSDETEPLQAADAGRIVYAGHSMGGHGAWVLATTDPDRALGVVVGAGWTSKETYGGSNTLFDHDISSTYTEPALMGLLRSTVYESDVDRYASNLAGLPVLVRVGAVDGTVPPYWSRKMSRLLHDVGVDVKYSELPGKEHWWWDTDKENDGGVNNDPEVREFIASAIGGGHGQAPTVPFELEVSSHNPATQPAARGIEFLQLHRPFYSPGRVRVVWNCEPSKATAWELRTSNVRRLRLYSLSGGWNASCVPASGLKVDSCELSQQEAVSLIYGRQHLFASQQARSGCGWQLSGADGLDASATLQRWPEAGGPARQLSSAGPFLTVVGTGGTPSNASDHLQAALFIANSHALGYNTFAPMVPDTELTSEEQIQSNNLLLMGGVKHNSVTRRWHAKAIAGETSAGTGLALLNKQGGVSLADKRYFSGPHTGILLVCPHYDAAVAPAATPPDRVTAGSQCTRSASGAAVCTGRHTGTLGLVIAAVDAGGLADIMAIATPTVPPMTRVPFFNTVPDLLVSGPLTEAQGWGGMQFAAHLDGEWRVRPEISWP